MKPISAVAFLLILVSGTVLGGNNPYVKAGIHVLPHDPERGCYLNFPDIDDPADIVFTYGGCDEVDFFPIFYDLTECKGVEYALVWPGSQTCCFHVCSWGHLGEIINPGDGISQIWTDCVYGYSVIPGWGEVTLDTYGLVCLAPHETTGAIKVLDCNLGIDYPNANYCAGVCGRPGENPLLPDQATIAGTWGGIKILFE